MSRADSEIFQSRIAKFAKYLPIEVARAREPEGAKKGKGKQDQDNDLQNHGVALVNLSPILFSSSLRSLNCARFRSGCLLPRPILSRYLISIEIRIKISDYFRMRSRYDSNSIIDLLWSANIND